MSAGIAHPNSTIHFPAGRRVRSIPFTHGFRTSAFGRPFGFDGRRRHARAWSPERSASIGAMTLHGNGW